MFKDKKDGDKFNKDEFKTEFILKNQETIEIG